MLNAAALALSTSYLERGLSGTSCTRGPACVVDCGVHSRGGLEAGLAMASVCLAGRARVELAPPSGDWPCPLVTVRTDDPVAACLASQYAGWQISVDDYFAMASGPMRAAQAKEPLFETIGFQERPSAVVGVLEASELPPEPVCAAIAAECQVPADQLTLWVAPTDSLAGTVQVVARCVETALHKLHELDFDLDCLIAGWGAAPLPPVASGFVPAIGRTNDAVLYGGQVILWARGEDAVLEEIGPRVPSSASSDYGRPFAEIFATYQGDFYQVDPLLFSPAQVTFVNVESGRSFQFGRIDWDVLNASFGITRA